MQPKAPRTSDALRASGLEAPAPAAAAAASAAPTHASPAAALAAAPADPPPPPPAALVSILDSYGEGTLGHRLAGLAAQLRQLGVPDDQLADRLGLDSTALDSTALSVAVSDPMTSGNGSDGGFGYAPPMGLSEPLSSAYMADQIDPNLANALQPVDDAAAPIAARAARDGSHATPLDGSMDDFLPPTALSRTAAGLSDAAASATLPDELRLRPLGATSWAS